MARGQRARRAASMPNNSAMKSSRCGASAISSSDSGFPGDESGLARASTQAVRQLRSGLHQVLQKLLVEAGQTVAPVQVFERDSEAQFEDGWTGAVREAVAEMVIKELRGIWICCLANAGGSHHLRDPIDPR